MNDNNKVKKLKVSSPPKHSENLSPPPPYATYSNWLDLSWQSWKRTWEALTYPGGLPND